VPGYSGAGIAEKIGVQVDMKLFLMTKSKNLNQVSQVSMLFNPLDQFFFQKDPFLTYLV